MIILQDSTNTDSKSGGNPYSRDISELFQSGVIIVNKPRGPTSHQLASWARNLLGIKTRPWWDIRSVCNRGSDSLVWQGHEAN